MKTKREKIERVYSAVAFGSLTAGVLVLAFSLVFFILAEVWGRGAMMSPDAQHDLHAIVRGLVPAGTDPKQLRATITGCPQPDYIGKVAFSIFKIEDGTLTLVGHEPGAPDAPKNFDVIRPHAASFSRGLSLKERIPNHPNPNEPGNA